MSRLADLTIWCSDLTGRIYAGYTKGNVATAKIDITEQVAALYEIRLLKAEVERWRDLGGSTRTMLVQDQARQAVRR